MITIDLSQRQVLDVDPRAIQQINFTANLDKAGNRTMFFVIEEAKETLLEFSKGTVKFLRVQLRSIQFSLSNLSFIV